MGDLKKGKEKTPDSDAKKEKTGAKRKSKGKEESDPEVKLKKVKNGGTDQRVFVTKTDDDDKKLKKKKTEKSSKKQRAVSPKFFVTLDGEKKAKDEKVSGKATSPAKQTDHLIIHPNITSDDSDDESSKNIFPTRNTTAQARFYYRIFNRQTDLVKIILSMLYTPINPGYIHRIPSIRPPVYNAKLLSKRAYKAKVDRFIPFRRCKFNAIENF